MGHAEGPSSGLHSLELQRAAEGCSQGGSLSVYLPILGPATGCREPYGFVLRQPVGDAEAADLCRDLLPVAWFGDPNGREVLVRGAAR